MSNQPQTQVKWFWICWHSWGNAQAPKAYPPTEFVTDSNKPPRCHVCYDPATPSTGPYTGQMYQGIKAPVCECGADSIKAPFHSPWCPKYTK